MAQSEETEGTLRRITALEAALMVLGAFFLCAWATGHVGGQDSIFAWALATHFPPLVMLIGAVVIARRHRPLLPPLVRGYSTSVLILAAACLGLAGGTSIGPTLLGPMAPGLDETHRLLWGIAWVGVVAPIIEELYFRGVLQTALRQSRHVWFAVGASALAFGLAHVGMGSVTFYLCLGIFFGAMAAMSGSLLPAIVAHVVWNVGTISVGITPGPWRGYPIALLIAGTALLLVGCAMRLWEEREP